MLASPPELFSEADLVPAAFEVRSTRRENSDTWTLELLPPGGESFPFEPGQFTMISSRGSGEVPISICGDPGRPDRLVHTVRAVGPATRALCAVQPGQRLSVRGPFGHSWPVAQAAELDVIVVAGGIGLPPLRPAILEMLAHRERYGRLVLLYGARTPDQLLYPEEVRTWTERGLEVHMTVDSAGPEWLGHVGVVPRLVPRAGPDGSRTIVMCCGPEVMMRFTVAALDEAGVSRERIFASMERNMQCAVARCGHCQLGPTLVCRDGPVYRWSEIDTWLRIREL